MHEVAIAQSIINIAVRVAKENGRKKISIVRIQVGELRQIIREQLAFCFAFVAEGTLAQGAKLEVEVIPIEALCESCGKEFSVKNLNLQCPVCKVTSVRILRGKELRVLDLELS